MAVEHPARLADSAKATLPFSVAHSLVKSRLVLVLEALLSLFLLLEADLELREVEILRVAEALKKEPVHDLGERLVPAADTAIGRDVEDDSVSGDLSPLIALEQHLQLLVARALERSDRQRTPRRRLPVRDSDRPSILAKLDLPEPKKPETQNSDALVGLVRRLAVGLVDTGRSGLRIASVTTYSLISSRRISSSVWSTLMTSSIRRWMSSAKRLLDGLRGGHLNGLLIRRSSGGSCARRRARP